MSLKWPPKDPDEVLDYQIDWSKRVANTDAIVSSTWIVPTGITKDSDSFTDFATIIWLSSGTLDEEYTLTNRVTTTEGRTMDQSVDIKIRTK